MQKSLALILVLALGTALSDAKPKHKQHGPKISQDQKNAGFRQLFTSLFIEWDQNHDGKLDLKELNAVIQNPQIRGSQAAIAVYWHRYLQVDEEGKEEALSLAQIQAMADDPKAQKKISGKAWHIEAINHSLFISGDPNLMSFHQGGIGDCYLLAVIGTLVYQHPETVAHMIQPLPDGGFQVQFGNRKKVVVPPLTDAELIMGAREGSDHGVWLSVLEKAYAQIRKEDKEQKTGQKIEADDEVSTDFIGHGGRYGPVITTLTGHKISHAAFAKWIKQNPSTGMQRAHELLAKLSIEHKLMAVSVMGSVSGPLPKGIVHKHAYGVFNYNPVTHMVMVFNPWGNHVKPAGPPGPINGYPTEHGIFAVPLNQFVQIFGGFTYETDKQTKPAL